MARSHINTAKLNDGVIAVVDAGAGSATIVAAPAVTKAIRVLSYVLTVSAATTVQWKSNVTNKSGVMTLATGISAPEGANGRLFQCGAGEALNLAYTAAGTYGGHLTYQLVEVPN